jgi:hypothetical protein
MASPILHADHLEQLTGDDVWLICRRQGRNFVSLRRQGEITTVLYRGRSRALAEHAFASIATQHHNWGYTSVPCSTRQAVAAFDSEPDVLPPLNVDPELFERVIADPAFVAQAWHDAPHMILPVQLGGERERSALLAEQVGADRVLLDLLEYRQTDVRPLPLYVRHVLLSQLARRAVAGGEPARAWLVAPLLAGNGKTLLLRGLRDEAILRHLGSAYGDPNGWVSER